MFITSKGYAVPLINCSSSDRSLQLELNSLESGSPEASVEAIIHAAQDSNVYFRVYPLSVGTTLVYKSPVEPGFDGPNEDDGPIVPFRFTINDASKNHLGNSVLGNLVVREYQYEKKYFCDGAENPVIPRSPDDPFVIKNHCKRWDMVRQPLKSQQYAMNCQMLSSQYKNFCFGKTKQDLQSLLFASAVNANPDLSEQSLACGADIVNSKDARECTPLMMAVSEYPTICAANKPLELDAYQEVKRRLLFNLLSSQGSYINLREKITGESSLHKAVKMDSEGIVQDMISLESDLDLQDYQGSTALMFAVDSGYNSIIKMLVEGGANLGIKDNQNRTAYDRSSNLPDEVRMMLLEPKAILNVEGKLDGTCTPLKMNAPLNEYVKINLKAPQEKMFLLSISDANVSLMADYGKTSFKTFKFTHSGAFSFECGAHGGKQYSGQIVVK